MENDQRKHLLAILHVGGLSTAEMSKRTGYSEGAITTIRGSDLFKAHVARLQRLLEEEMTQSVLQRVEEEAPRSMDVLMQIRSGAFDPNSKEAVRLQLDAVKFHLGDLYMDRFHPKVTKQETDRTVRITFDGQAIHQMMGALAEDRGEIIDVTPSERPAVLILKDSSLLPMTVEEAVEVLDDGSESD